MMTNLALQPTINTTGEALITPTERQTLMQRLKARGASDGWVNIERQAYENSKGVKTRYLAIMQNYYEQMKKMQQSNLNQAAAAAAAPAVNNNIQYVNQPINLPQQQTAPMLNHPQNQLNHQFNQQQPRFSSIQLSAPQRVQNPSTGMINNQSILHSQAVRLSDPQKFNQASLNPISYSSTPPTIQTIDLSQTYRPQPQPPPPPQPQQQHQQPIANPTLSDYLSQPPALLNRFANQPSLAFNQRQRAPTALNDTFTQQTASTNSNNVLQQYVVNNPPTIPNIPHMTNTSSTGDRLLQQILLSNNNNPTAAAAIAASNKMTLQNRQTINPTPIPQQIRPVNSMNSVNSIRPTLATQQASPSPPVPIMPTPPSNVQIQSTTNIPAQPSPLNNNNPSLLVNSQSPSVPNNTYSSPVNRSGPLSGSGNISSPDEEIIQLTKFLRENISRLQAYCQKFSNEGNLEKARNAQLIHQQMVQFITNPTYEGLPQAKHIRDMLEKASNRPQTTNAAPGNVPAASSTSAPSINEFQQLEKDLSEFFNGDSKKRQMINRFFTEPLSDVINGVAHKKIRLDIDDRFHSINEVKSPSTFNPSLLISKLNAELHLLPTDRFSVQFLPVSHTATPTEFNDEYLSKNGLVLRCKLIEADIPLVPILRLRIFPRYPEEQPEILSLTKTMPPKLESTDGHPFFERISTIFISHLFKLPAQHTVTDVLNLWYQSIRSAL